ncbi:MAG: Sec-independent protein translocase protein TatB [Sulfuricaulis sp.]|uniref:Sec-independent protein translocase protein TatB n=1 Tax=Sulfuricaulis sp. TaxID=2003553 RepID=UPI0025DDD655|nr:Sec-independent protein translocase protein TatB [Sulfuricaulis sp.]MCR4347084.1 Sec-independent protein translocase protein TatB [Sulfuricaulis sp.]
MFDIGFSELVAVGLIALIVLGPKRLPEVARTAGRWMGQLRRFIADVKQDIDREVNSEDLAELRKLKLELNDTRRMMQNTSGELVKGFTEITPEPSSPTIHSPETTALPHTSFENAKRSRARAKSGTGKKHGKARKARRR